MSSIVLSMSLFSLLSCGNTSSIDCTASSSCIISLSVSASEPFSTVFASISTELSVIVMGFAGPIDTVISASLGVISILKLIVARLASTFSSFWSFNALLLLSSALRLLKSDFPATESIFCALSWM